MPPPGRGYSLDNFLRQRDYRNRAARAGSLSPRAAQGILGSFQQFGQPPTPDYDGNQGSLPHGPWNFETGPEEQPPTLNQGPALAPPRPPYRGPGVANATAPVGSPLLNKALGQYQDLKEQAEAGEFPDDAIGQEIEDLSAANQQRFRDERRAEQAERKADTPDYQGRQGLPAYKQKIAGGFGYTVGAPGASGYAPSRDKRWTEETQDNVMASRRAKEAQEAAERQAALDKMEERESPTEWRERQEREDPDDQSPAARARQAYRDRKSPSYILKYRRAAAARARRARTSARRDGYSDRRAAVTANAEARRARRQARMAPPPQYQGPNGIPFLQQGQQGVRGFTFG